MIVANILGVWMNGGTWQGGDKSLEIIWLCGGISDFTKLRITLIF